jgi:predicted 2-oxoglutarate/Fe(II)-dependent dioxygenase YbiX
MQIVIGNVLSAEEVETVRAALARARFVDGKATAGFAARQVKNNRQAEGSDRSLGPIRTLVAERILGNGSRSGPRRSPRSCSPVTRPACTTAAMSTTP